MRRIAALSLALVVLLPAVPAGGAAGCAVRARTGVAFTAGPSPRLLDAHLPTGPGARPAVVFVHGGGWRAGDRTWWTAQARRAAARGWASFTIDYRLAPAARFPAAVQDVRAAVRWVRANARALRVDPSRVALVGGSAGGHLALLAATASRPGAPDRPDAVVAWSAPTDLRGPQPSTLAPLIRDLLGCTPAVCPRRAASASPVRHADAGDPATLLVHSRRELVPLAHATALDARLAAAGVPRRLVVAPGSAHSAQLGNAAWQPTVAFLDRVLGRPVC